MAVIEIKNRWTGVVIYAHETTTEKIKSGIATREAVEAAVCGGVNLSGADLSSADLRDADLSDADLRGVPRIKNIHQSVFDAASKPGALNMSGWHCGTAHCRAGWVVTLAGEAGAAMEFCMGTPAAAAMIYLASDPELANIPDFYADNATALADMERLAKLEREKDGA